MAERRERTRRDPGRRDTSRRTTARGLSQTPRKARESAVQSREQPVRRRRPVRTKLFSLGQGLDMPLFVFIMVLLAVGLVMLFSASYAYSYYRQGGDSYYYIRRQGMFALAGVAAMLLISTFDYHRFHKLAYPIFVVAVVLLGAAFVFGQLHHVESIAPSEGVATRWLRLGPIQFQPSEAAKFALIVVLAHYISQHVEEMEGFVTGALKPILLVGAVAGLIVLEKHLSGTLIVGLLGVLMLFLGGTRVRHLLVLGIIAGILLLAVLGIRNALSPEEAGEAVETAAGGYQMDRVIGWLHPFDPPEGVDTWQIRQSLYSIGSGGLLGVGLGQSRQKYLWLPEPQNDFIFAIVCEELGLIGALVVIILFSLLIWRGMYISLHAKDKFGTMLGLGITLQVGIQAVLNICVVTNTIPNTGISLPFFSYGGTSLMILLGEMGILLNISRSANVERT